MCDGCGWRVTLEDIEDALTSVEELPDRAEEFANSVDEKLRSMHEWITKNEHTTEPQQNAVDNMASAIRKWLD